MGKSWNECTSRLKLAGGYGESCLALRTIVGLVSEVLLLAGNLRENESVLRGRFERRSVPSLSYKE